MSDLLRAVAGNKMFRSIMKPLLKTRQLYLRRKNNQKLEVYNFLSDALVEDPILKISDFNGVFEIDKRSTIFRRLLIQQEYESTFLKLIVQFINPKKDIIDIGANIGFYSIFFGKQINEYKRVLSVEPTKNAFKKLERNVILNGLSDKILLYQGVVSDRAGTKVINTIEGKEEYSSIGAMHHPSIQGIPFQSYNVTSSTLDELVNQFSLEPGFIKIDVEGAENLVLQGSSETLLKHRPCIFLELSDHLLRKNGSTASHVLSLLRSNHYKVIDALNPSGKLIIKDSNDILCIPEELDFEKVVF